MKWLTTEVYSVLYYLTTGPFSAKIFHSWAIFCRNISQLGHLLLGCSLQEYFTAGPFSAEILYCWAISYSVYFYYIEVSTVETAHGPFLSIPT